MRIEISDVSGRDGAIFIQSIIDDVELTSDQVDKLANVLTDYQMKVTIYEYDKGEHYAESNEQNIIIKKTMTDTELAHRMASILEKTEKPSGCALAYRIKEAFPEPPKPKDREWWLGKDVHGQTCVQYYKNNNWYNYTGSTYPATFTPIRKMQEAE